jgi:DUF1365 family protein
MTPASGLYCGLVTHARTRPRPHRLAYRIFMLLIDLDEAAALPRRVKTLGIGRLNLFGFDEARHGDGSGQPLKAQIEATLAQAGLAHGGPVRVLAMPQILGRAFNPLAVVFCHQTDGTLSAILYEVSNTFGERHAYLIPAPDGPQAERRIRKDFYVSPFMDMDLSYRFHIRRPEARVKVVVDAHDADGLVLAASFAGERAELTDANLLKAWLTHPWMTVGVLAAIHLEALKIWLKGEKVRVRAPEPGRRVTVAPAANFAA